MDPTLQRAFHNHIVYLCKGMLLAVEDMKTGNPDRMWYGVQNFVVGAGNVSKTLWGVGKPDETAARYITRQPLREALEVTDASPLRQVVIRNDFEHMDERLDTWWRDEPNHNIFIFIGPRGAISGNIGPKERMQWFDPATGDIIFWGNELNVVTVAREILRIKPLAEAACSLVIPRMPPPHAAPRNAE
jgi:hypothetical protein